MDGFICVLTCINCGVQTDRNGVCVACQRTITPYRLRYNGKMGLIITDGTHFKYVTDVSCQRCNATQINEYFDDEGTCYTCKVHNSIKPHVIGQWYFFLYHQTLAPMTTPIKNIIEEIPDNKAKNLVKKMDGYYWERDEQSRYQTSSMEDILDNILKEGNIPLNDMKIYQNKEGIDPKIGSVTCLMCGGQPLVDKSCEHCGTENDIIIRKNNDSGKMYFVNISHRKETGEKRYKELSPLECKWCPYRPITSLDLKCSQCGTIYDARMQQVTTTKTIKGRHYTETLHEVSLYPLREKRPRPKNALKIIGVPAPQKTTSTPLPASTANNNLSGARMQQRHPTTHIQRQPAQTVQFPMVKVPPEEKSKSLDKKLSVFKRSPKKQADKPVSARTIRRHTKEQRDAEDKRLQKIARKLYKQYQSERKVAENITEMVGYKIGRSKVKRWIK